MSCTDPAYGEVKGMDLKRSHLEEGRDGAYVAQCVDVHGRDRQGDRDEHVQHGSRLDFLGLAGALRSQAAQSVCSACAVPMTLFRKGDFRIASASANLRR